VIVIDANVLLYAHDTASAGHEPARRWLESTLTDEPDVRFALTTLLAFVRISSDPRVFEQPRSSGDAISVVEGWLGHPNVSIASPGDRHWRILSDLATRGQARGPLLMDAHLAALAVEHGATLATTDRDFTRFPGLRVLDPVSDATARRTRARR
jgi:toxin-antitoxin system PIN domain toxin